MSIKDVIKGKQSFVSWLTGHDPKESDVYSNPQKVDDIEKRIRDIASSKVASAQEAITSACKQLNSVHGLSDYVGAIDVTIYNPFFESIKDSVNGIADKMREKADSIKTYEEKTHSFSGVLEIMASTNVMTVCKVGEGLLSVAEDLGDGVLSLAGWVSGIGGKDNKVQKFFANAVKKEWSHDVFNVYYKSDFAKASMFTEDSAIAGGFKIAGKAIGYLYAGGVFGSAIQGLAHGATVVGSGILATSTSTLGATAAGFIGGLGSGTEAGLNTGLSYNDSMKIGLKTGAIQGGMAFVGGKIGEKLQKASNMKAAQKAVDEADEAVKTAAENVNKYGAEMMNPDITDGMADVAKNNYEAALEAQALAKEQLTNAQSLLETVKGTTYQGYSDAVTQAGERFGKALGGTVKDGAKYLGKASSAGMAKATSRGDSAKLLEKEFYAKEADAVAQKALMKDSVSELAHNNPFAHGWQATKAAGDMGVKEVLISGAKAQIQPAALATEVGAIYNNKVQNAGLQNIDYKSMMAAGTEAISKMGESITVQNVPEIGTQQIETPISEVPVTSSSDNTPINPSYDGTSNNNSNNNTNNYPYSNYPSNSYPSSSYPSYSSNNGGYRETNTNADSVEKTMNLDSKEVAESISITPENKPEKPKPPRIPHVAESTTSKPQQTTTTVSQPVSQAQPVSTSTTSTPISVPTNTGTSYTGVAPTVRASAVPYTETTATETSLDPELKDANQLDLLDDITENSASISDVFRKGKKISKIPVSTEPVKSQKGSIIPIAAGLSVAAAAGLGAKAYMDYKKNNDMNDEEEYDEEFDDYEEDSWMDNETIEDENNTNLSYDQGSMSAENPYIEGNDDYFKDDIGSYSAKNMNELPEVS